MGKVIAPPRHSCCAGSPMDRLLTLTTALLGIVLVALRCSSRPNGDAGANSGHADSTAATGLDNWILRRRRQLARRGWRHPGRQEDRQGEQFSGYEKLVHRLSNPRRVLGQRRRQLRYLHAVRRHQESDRSRRATRRTSSTSAPTPSTGTGRHRSSVAGVADAQGRRQVERLRRHCQRPRVWSVTLNGVGHRRYSGHPVGERPDRVADTRRVWSSSARCQITPL